MFRSNQLPPKMAFKENPKNGQSLAGLVQPQFLGKSRMGLLLNRMCLNMKYAVFQNISAAAPCRAAKHMSFNNFYNF